MQPLLSDGTNDPHKFPCWLWSKNARKWFRCYAGVIYANTGGRELYTHWHPDQPTAPEPVKEGISPEKAESMVNQIWTAPPADWAERAARDYLGNPGGDNEDAMYHECDVDDLTKIILRHSPKTVTHEELKSVSENLMSLGVHYLQLRELDNDGIRTLNSQLYYEAKRIEEIALRHAPKQEERG